MDREIRNGIAVVAVAISAACNGELAAIHAGMDGGGVSSSGSSSGTAVDPNVTDASQLPNGNTAYASTGIASSSGGFGSSSSSGSLSSSGIISSTSSSGIISSASSSGISLPSSSSGGGTVVSSSGFSGSSSSSTGVPLCESSTPCIPGPADYCLIDDMSGERNSTGGYWYTFSDRTVPYSAPPVIELLSDGGVPPGTIRPPEGTPYLTSVDQTTLLNGTTVFYRSFDADGETTWGAGFGMDFTDVPPTLGQVPFNSCNGSYELPDGSTQIFDVNDSAVTMPLPYDASCWTGVQFWMASLETTITKVIVNIDDDQTSPWGGICGACVTTPEPTPPFECSNSWATPILATPTWTLYQIPFALMKPDSNWNGQGLKSGGIHTNKLYNLHWKFETAASPMPLVYVGVAMVSFYQ